MKYSRSLEFACAGEWKEFYLAYATLKRAINQIAAAVAMEKAKTNSVTNLNAIEESFTKLFKEELTRVAKFYDEQKRTLLNAETTTASTGDAFEAKVLELNYCKLGDLKEFLQMNHTGFQKLLKSHDKYSRTLLQGKLQSQVDAAFPQNSDLEVISNKLLAVERAYAAACCQGNADVAKERLASLYQDQAMQHRASAWQEMISRDQPTSMTVVAAEKPVAAPASAAPAAVHHKENPYRIWQLLVLGVIFIAIICFPILPDGTMNRCMAMCILAIGLWITEAVPLYVTASAIPILIVVLELMKKDDAGAALVGRKAIATFVLSKMFSGVTLMLLGGFSIAAATTKFGVARQIALVLLRFAGRNTGLLVALVMFLAQFISAFVSNVTAPVLCFTLLAPLLRAIPPENPLARQLVLAVAVASNVGGAISPISSPQNVFAIGMLGNPSWSTWLAIAVPFCLFTSVGSWFVIMGPGVFKKDATGKGFNCASYFGTSNVFSWGLKEITVVLTILVTIALWGLDHGTYFGNNGLIALIPVLIFFGSGMLGKDEFNSFPWTVIMLAIGGCLMGDALRNCGLLNLIADSLKIFSTYSLFMQCCLVSLIVTIATCFISHTVGAMIFLPIVQGVSNGSRIVMMGACLACSAGMALPISSFPNMAASSQEDSLGRPILNTSQFARYGIMCSLITWVAICAISYPIMTMIGF